MVSGKLGALQIRLPEGNSVQQTHIRAACTTGLVLPAQQASPIDHLDSPHSFQKQIDMNIFKGLGGRVDFLFVATLCEVTTCCGCHNSNTY